MLELGKLRSMIELMSQGAYKMSQLVNDLPSGFATDFKTELIRFVVCIALHGKMKEKVCGNIIREYIQTMFSDDEVHRFYAIKELQPGQRYAVSVSKNITGFVRIDNFVAERHVDIKPLAPDIQSAYHALGRLMIGQEMADAEAAAEMIDRYLAIAYEYINKTEERTLMLPDYRVSPGILSDSIRGEEEPAEAPEEPASAGTVSPAPAPDGGVDEEEPAEGPAEGPAEEPAEEPEEEPEELASAGTVSPVPAPDGGVDEEEPEEGPASVGTVSPAPAPDGGVDEEEPAEEPSSTGTVSPAPVPESDISSDSRVNVPVRQAEEEPVEPEARTGKALQPGMRISMEEVKDHRLCVMLSCTGMKTDVDIDAYAFLLNDEEKTGKDEDLIFFGNPMQGSAVELDGRNDHIGINVQLDKLSPDVSIVSVCFSVYGDDEEHDLGRLLDPVVRVIDRDKELYYLPLEGMDEARTIVAVQFYRKRNEWKLKAIAGRYKGDLKALCESYGLTVE